MRAWILGPSSAALLAACAASAEPAPFLTGPPSSVEGVETGLADFVACADYIAHHEAAQPEAERHPGAVLDCEIAHLMGRARPCEGPPPTACELVDAAMGRLDLRSFANGSRPRIPEEGGPTTLEDLYEVSWVARCGGAVAQDEGWQVSVAPLATGAWTGDGVADGLVVIEELAGDGIYASIRPLVLTGLDGPRVTGLSVCAFLDLDQPDRCVSDRSAVVE